MSYIVVYQRADGSAGVEECGDLDLAIVTAERLRNVDSVERPRIFKTEEISYDFRPYYRVEVTTASDDVEDMSATESTIATPTTAISGVPSAEPTGDPFASESSFDPFATEEVPEEVAEAPMPPPPPIPGHLAEPTAAGSEATDSNVSALSEAAANAHSASEQLSDTDDIPAATAGGLFSTDLDDGNSAIADLEAEVTEVEPDPPRRGLFGR